MRLAGAALSIVMAVSFAAAEPAKQTAPAKAAPAPKAEKKAATDAIAASYTAIPVAERVSIQNDLAWTGDYNGAINGEFGERAIAAVKAFQKRNGGKETGVLNQPERAALAAAAKPKQDAVGWRMVDDLMSGARLGIPTRLMPNTHFSGGVGKWTSARGETSVEPFRITGSGTALPAVFERMKKEPTGRKP